MGTINDLKEKIANDPPLPPLCYSSAMAEINFTTERSIEPMIFIK